MKLKKIHIMVFIGVMFLCFFGNLFSITEEETQKIRSAIPEKRIMQSEKSRTVLVFSLCNGFKHSSISYWQQALDIMGKKTGAFKVIHSSDMSVFTTDSLKQFDVICFNNTTHLIPDNSQQKAIMDFIKGGKGIVGIHAATDNFYEWPEGMEMMGGVFKGHPWGGGGTWAVKIDDPDHPLMKSFNGQGFKIKDEIYRTAPPLYSREKQRVLMSLDMSDPTTKNVKGVEPDDMDTGISWVKPVGSGRLFYCSLGHDHAVAWNRAVLEHYLAGIQYAMGDLDVDDSPVKPGSKKLSVPALDNLVLQLREYDWDKNRAVPIQLQSLIQSYYGNEEALNMIEGMLLATLKSDATLAAKDFVCRQLAVIGTQKSVPVLSGMLADPKTSNMARYALEKIPGGAVEEVLTEAARNTNNKEILIGIISTLGVRKSEGVVSLARDVFSNTAKNDEDTRIVLLWALGSVGTEESAVELLRIKPNLTGRVMQRWSDASLMCANALLEAGSNQKAIDIYQKLYQSETPSVIRAAALTGLAQTGADNVPTLLPKAIQGEDLAVRTAAIRSLAYIENNSLLNSIVSDAPDLAGAAQIQLLTVLSEKSRDIGRSFALQMIGSDQPSVRIAAYQALARTGDVSVIEILANAAGQAQDRNERIAAQEALYRIPGKDIDAAILEKLAAAADRELDEKVVVELINATVNRQIQDAPKVLFQTAKSDNRRISSESIGAIQSLAGPEYAEELVELLISRPGTNTENALLVVAEKISNRDFLAAMILAKYSEITDNKDARASMLRVMGKLGGKDTIGLIRTEYASSNEKLNEAAFRAMTDWPGDDFIREMKTIAQSDIDTKTKILAFRAYIRMLEDSADKNRQQKVDELIAAYSLAERPDEQKIVIGVLGHYGDTRALNFVKDKLNDPALKAEAQVSLLQICEKLLTRNPSAVKPVLQNLKEDAGSNESVKKNAEELLQKIVDLDGFVLDWQVSGPYMAEGQSGDALFNFEFAPEKDYNNGKWKDALEFFPQNNSAIFDLSRLGEGPDRVAYLKTTLSVEKATPVIFEIGSDDGVKVWVNGKQVHTNNTTRPLRAGQDKVSVGLEKGQNQVLVKVVQQAGEWAFCMKISDADGNPVSSLDVDAGN